MAGCIMCSVSIPVSLYRVHKGQMTQQSERMRTAMLSVLDKVYLTENLPESWRALHDKAYAAAYVKAAARAYHACEYIYAKKDLAEAVRLDPSLIENDGRILSEILSGWSDAPMGEEPLAYLEAVYKNFPDGFLSAHHYRRYFALKSIQLAFEAYQQNDLNNTRSYVLRAIQYQPEWLKNRGVLAILFRSLFHL
jgi:tetratricopeptide (TPR) repeat protein